MIRRSLQHTLENNPSHEITSQRCQIFRNLASFKWFVPSLYSRARALLNGSIASSLQNLQSPWQPLCTFHFSLCRMKSCNKHFGKKLQSWKVAKWKVQTMETWNWPQVSWMLWFVQERMWVRGDGLQLHSQVLSRLKFLDTRRRNQYISDVI